MCWSESSIASHLRMDVDATLQALYWLRFLGHVEPRCGEWFFTPYGKEVYLEESKSPWLQTGSAVQRFREEALSGTTAEGKQSKIESAALPSLVHTWTIKPPGGRGHRAL